MIAGSNRKQNGNGVCGVHVNGIFRERDAAAFGDDLSTDLQRDTVMTAAVHALVAVAIEHQGVVAGGVDGTRDGAYRSPGGS